MSANSDKLTLKSRWVLRRNAILGSSRFQRWASRTPIIRGIARRRAAAQFDMIAGFVYSQILVAFVEAGLIEFLGGQVHTLDSVAEFTGLKPDAALRLLKAAESLKITECPQAEVWTLGEAGAPLSANAGALAMILHHHLLYQDLAEPLKLLSNGRHQETALSAYWTYASRGQSEATASGYSNLMAATQPMVSEQIIDAYDFTPHRRMLDIGGGSGAFTLAIREIAPQMHFGIFDLPDVITEAAKRLGPDSPINPIELHPGSFKSSPLPEGYDLITLVRILHDHDDEVSQTLLKRIFEALPSGGRLLIVEPMSGSNQAEPMGEAYFGMYLWAMGSGRPRSFNDTKRMLHEAGFKVIKPLKTALPIITSALVAIK